MGAVAARVCCTSLPRLRRNLSGTQKLLPHGSDFCRPNFWDVNTRENTRFVLCHFFWDVKNWLPYTPVGAESDAIAIRMGIPASRWVLNGTQLRSEWAHVHSDGCGSRSKYDPNGSPCTPMCAEWAKICSPKSRSMLGPFGSQLLPIGHRPADMQPY